jgi:hypothetical protein
MEATQLSNVAEEEADMSEGEQSYVPTHLHKRMGRSSLIARMLEPPTHQVQSTTPAVTIAPVAAPTLAAPKPTTATQGQTAAAGGQPNDSSSSSSTTSVNPPQRPVTPGRRRRIPRQGQPPNPPAGPPGPQGPPGPPPGPNPPPGPPGANPPAQPPVQPIVPIPVQARNTELHFDTRLKMSDIPEWDSNPDTLADWVIGINNLSNRSTAIFNGLGKVIPLRLTGRAKDWYDTQPRRYHEQITQDWHTMRIAISEFFMNRPWLDKQKNKAIKAHFRDINHSSESPSDYILRKWKLLSMAYLLSDTELILEVMNGAPQYWRTVIDTSMMTTFQQLQISVKHHEEILLAGPSKGEGSSNKKEMDRMWEALRNIKKSSNSRQAKSHAVAQTPPKKYPYPRNDKIVSKKATPKSKGAGPCRFCGSDMHWDNECSHYSKNAKKLRSFFASATEDELAEQEEYERIMEELSSAEQSEEEDNYVLGESESEPDQDF